MRISALVHADLCGPRRHAQNLPVQALMREGIAVQRCLAHHVILNLKVDGRSQWMRHSSLPHCYLHSVQVIVVKVVRQGLLRPLHVNQLRAVVVRGEVLLIGK